LHGDRWITFERSREHYDGSAACVSLFNPLRDRDKTPRSSTSRGTAATGSAEAPPRCFDGSLGSRTPSSTSLTRRSFDPRHRRDKREDLRAWMGEADKVGLSGRCSRDRDESNDIVLDTMAEVPAVNGARTAFSHRACPVAEPERRSALRETAVIASVQPYMQSTTGVGREAIGPERLTRTYASRA